MRKRLLLITGSPGTGKTSVLLKAVDALKARGYSVGGVISREARVGWARVGKYRVNLEDLDNIGANAIVNAAENFDVVAIDEIGPMELFSEKFKEAVKRAVESGKLVIGVVHWKAKDMLVEEVKNREDTEIIVVTYENRDNLHEAIIEKAMDCLKRGT